VVGDERPGCGFTGEGAGFGGREEVRYFGVRGGEGGLRMLAVDGVVWWGWARCGVYPRSDISLGACNILSFLVVLFVLS
jgi:hypothetical protein